MMLETERLMLRPLVENDKQALYNYRSNAEVNKYQGWIPETLDDAAEFIAKLAKSINEPHSWFQLLIIEKVSHKVVGDLGLHFFDDENQQLEFGITLAVEFHGQGYASEALTGVLNFAFHILHKHRVTASIDPNNTSSIALVERLGFRKEAHFVESLYLNGRWCDDLVYALTEKEWFSRDGK